MSDLPIRRCVKVASLRKAGYTSFQDWLANPRHHYAGRPGRIFIGSGDDKEIFHYKGSPLQNPYTIKQWGLNLCLELYKTHLQNLDLSILEAVDEIGCFCDDSSPCHVDLLIAGMKK